MKTAAILGYREDNPCRGVPLPKSTATDDDMRLLTHAEARLIIDAIPDLGSRVHPDDRGSPLTSAAETAREVGEDVGPRDAGAVNGVQNRTQARRRTLPRRRARDRGSRPRSSRSAISASVRGASASRSTGCGATAANSRIARTSTARNMILAWPSRRCGISRALAFSLSHHQVADHLGHLLGGEGSQLGDDVIG